MNKVERRKKELHQVLQEEESIDIGDVAKRFHISLPTARRLSSQLAEEGMAIRVHGGLKKIDPLERLSGKSEDSYSFDMAQKDFVEEKTRIAEYASQLVKDNQVIFIEAGTTVRLFSIALAKRIRHNEISNLVIFTNSLITLNILAPVHSNIAMIGGHYRDNRKDFTGYLSELALNGLQFDSLFIGADAISLTNGIMAIDFDTVKLDSVLVSHSEKVYVLVHSEKFEKRSLISYLSISDAESIITDKGLDPVILQEYKNRNIRIITV